MVLEASVICIDNSEYSRNGDYLNTRLDGQRDVANIIFATKINDNPENAVGLLTMAGERVTVQISPTQDVGKFLQGLHDITVGGGIDVIKSLQLAQLALKHRTNKNQRQRIILFVGSPIVTSEKRLEQSGKMLKKNNISLDIISFGETLENNQKLTILHSAVDSNNTSHFVEYPVEVTRVLSEAIVSSPLFSEGQRPVGSSAKEELSCVSTDLGVDPSTDPELYMALQISIQEERARQASRAAATAEAEGLQTPSQKGTTVLSTDASRAANLSGTAKDRDTMITGLENDPIRVKDELPAKESLDVEMDEENVDMEEQQEEDAMDEELRQALLISLKECDNDADFDNEQCMSHELAFPTDVSIIPPKEVAQAVGSSSARTASQKEITRLSSGKKSLPEEGQKNQTGHLSQSSSSFKNLFKDALGGPEGKQNYVNTSQRKDSKPSKGHDNGEECPNSHEDEKKGSSK